MARLSLTITETELAELKARLVLEQQQARLYNLASGECREYKERIQAAYQLPPVFELDLATGDVTYEAATAERLNE